LGNCSFQLDKFGVTWTKAKSVNRCGFAGCTALAVGVGVYKPRNQVMGLCRLHFGAAQSNSGLWTDLRLSEGHR
jgi:hypothetical protein